jgi:hypothetical protein
VNGVTPGENANEATIWPGHQNRTDAAVAHELASLSDRCVKRKSNGILVSDDV